MAARFSKTQIRIMLILTGDYQRARELGIEQLHRLSLMNLVQQKYSKCCKSCGSATVVRCCTNPVRPSVGDSFLRLTPLGLEQQATLRKRQQKQDRMLFLSEEEACSHARAQTATLSNIQLVVFQLDDKNDDRWCVIAGATAPDNARKDRISYFRSETS